MKHDQFKYCPKCEASKDVADFYRRKNGYLSAWCKPCTTKANNAHRAEKRRLAREARAALPPAESKLCTACGESKPRDDFYVDKRTGKVLAECKPCRSARRREYYSRPEVRTRAAQLNRARAESERPRIRAKNLARYGMTAADYDDLFDQQHGKCAICRSAGARAGMGAPRTEVLCVDHHHVTNEVRGLLCQRCNRAIGLLGDDPEIIHSAIDYLTKEVIQE